jgi:hypothetical protein
MANRQFSDTSLLHPEKECFPTAFEASFFQHVTLARPLRHRECAWGSWSKGRSVVFCHPTRADPGALFWYYFRRGAAMRDNYGRLPREARARADERSEISMLWGLVIAALVVGIATMKGLFGWLSAPCEPNSRDKNQGVAPISIAKTKCGVGA